MRTLTSTALVAVLALSACEKPPAPAPTPGTSDGHPVEISYDCGGGKLLKATYPDARTAVVNYAGQSFTLTLGEAASGSRYVGGGREWWLKTSPTGEVGTLSPSAGGAAAGGPPIATCAKTTNTGSNSGTPTPGTGTDGPVTTPVGLAACKSGDLSLKHLSDDAGAGQRHVVYGIINNSGAACSLKGYVTAAWLDANGKPLDGVTVIQSEAGGPVSGPPAEVALQPKGRAVFFISYTGIQATDKACVTSSTMQATPPGNSQAIQIADVIAPCTDHITLGPVRADPGDAAL